MSKKLTLQQVIEKLHPKFKDSFDWSNAIFTKSSEKIRNIVCPKHGPFSQYAAQLYKGGAGCPKCGHEQISSSKLGKVSALKGKAQKWSQEKFIQESQKIHGDKYDYSKVVFKTIADKVTITCKVHGDFDQLAASHVAGKGCFKCGVDARSGLKVSHAEFLRRVSEIHGDKYTFPNLTYTNAQEKIEAVCKYHGTFYIRPNGLMQGKQCKKCADVLTGSALRSSLGEFVVKANQIHNFKYDYSKSVYTNARSKLTIICPVHGEFEQIAHAHLLGFGCALCAAHDSAGEQEIADFVVGLGFDVLRRDRTLIAPKELDIVVPRANLAIEYCGEYFHSDICARDAVNKHRVKYDACRSNGMHLITIYESEWLLRKESVKKVIQTLCGVSDSTTYARKLEIREVSISDARKFYAAEHLQGAPRKGLTYGLYSDDHLKACMTFSRGASLRGDMSTWELLRYASEGRVIGGASKLFKHFCKTQSPEVVVSFSDNRWFKGDMYATLGFVLDSESKPDYMVWSNKLKRLYHKSLFQRKSIPARLSEHGSDEIYDPESDPRSEREMTEFMGCGRIYDCGKKRWLWKTNA